MCAYCGCGCRLLFQVENGRIVKVVPDRTRDVSEGVACIKGLTIHEAVGKNEGRIQQPLMREDKCADFKAVSWDEAYSYIYERTRDLAPNEVFLNASGKVTNEDCYATQKFTRVARLPPNRR
jgi:predicted molibdopterin-dependent oxidoreductase YjgC